VVAKIFPELIRRESICRIAVNVSGSIVFWQTNDAEYATESILQRTYPFSQEPIMISAEFLLASLVVVLMPGAGVIYTVTTGLSRGARSSVAAACGCTAGILPHLAASILGLAALLHASAVAFQVVKIAGAFYMLYLAWSMWRETGTLKFRSGDTARGLRQIAVRGILINILNPKLSIFFLAFLPLFVEPGAGPAPLQMLVMSGVFMGMTLVVFLLYGLLADSVRGYASGSPQVVHRCQRTFAVIFAALGVRLMAADP
jgi:threonine/homoserine/homoserine lactone efflux protein